jgi:hypothetical protein
MTNLPRPHRKFNATRFTFELWRLNDVEYQQLRSRSFSIRYNSLFMLSLALIDRGKPDELILPKVLLVMEEEFGKSSKYIDDWKQTFSFPFLLAIHKPHGFFYYLLRIEDSRGGLEFNLCRVVDELKHVGLDLRVSHLPIEDELSNAEIEYLVSYLWGFLQARSEFLHIFQPDIKPFFRHIDASHVFYGYWDGKFVEEVIENETKYLRAVKKLTAKYGEPEISEAEKVDQTKQMILEITPKSIGSSEITGVLGVTVFAKEAGHYVCQLSRSPEVGAKLALKAGAKQAIDNTPVADILCDGQTPEHALAIALEQLASEYRQMAEESQGIPTLAVEKTAEGEAIKKYFHVTVHFEGIFKDESKFEAIHNTLVGNTVVENAAVTAIAIDPGLQVNGAERWISVEDDDEDK